MNKCIIMCAGSFSPTDLHREEGDYIIAADNGLSYLEQMGIQPDYIIGDYDSLADEEKEVLYSFEKREPSNVTTLPVEKDDTDSVAAVRVGLAKGFRLFVLYGALGGSRLDHTISNLQTLNFIREQGGKGYLVDDKCIVFVLHEEQYIVPRGFGGGFSLFAMDRETCVTIKGMQYETDAMTITNSFPIGISNHIDPDRQAFVEVKGGTALVYMAWNNAASRDLMLFM